MSVVRLIEYHCDLCGDPIVTEATGDDAARGLDWGGVAQFRVVPIAEAQAHLCGQCWRGLAAAIASEATINSS